MPEAYLEYNEIRLAYLTTIRVSQLSELDSSKSDQLYTRLRLVVKSIFSNSVVPAIEIDDGNGVRYEQPGETMSRVRHMLLSPRHSLTFSPAGGEDFITIGAPDENNGPKPTRCDITAITGETWEIEYEIEFTMRDCNAGTELRAWVSLRWTDTISYNEDWFATRRRTGTLILSSFGNLNNAENHRALITPEVPVGFRRKSAEYSLDKDNLTVNFTFTDVQLNQVPPMPATKLSGRMIVTSPLKGGVRVAEISLRLSAPKGVSKQELVAVAVRAAMSRLYKTDILNPAGKILMGGSVSEDLDDEKNVIELSLQWMVQPGAARVGRVDLNQPIQLGGGLNWVGVPLDGADPLRAIGPPTLAAADAVKMAAAVLGDPCGLAESAVAEAVANEGVPAATEISGAVLRVTSTGDASNLGPEVQLFSDFSGLYADDGPGTYEVYEITSHYTDEPGTAVRASTKVGSPSVALQYHAGRKRLLVEFTAEKIGGPPTIPDPQPDDSNVIYLGGTISPAGIDLAADSTRVRYSVSGRLEYAFLDATKVIVSAPLPPWISRSLASSAGQAAARLGPDIVFPTQTGADPFEDSGTQDIIPIGFGDGAGGDFGSSEGQPVYP